MKANLIFILVLLVATDAKLSLKQEKVGVVEEDGKYYFYNNKGEKESGWHKKEVDDVKYYYYFDKDTKAALIGFQRLKYLSKTCLFYFNEKGRMLTGWREIEGETYHFGNSGCASLGWEKKKLNGIKSEFYFDQDDGHVYKGLHKLKWAGGNDYFYFDGEGRCFKNGWKTKDGFTYFFSNDQGDAKTGWHRLKRSGKRSWFYFDNEAHMVKGIQKLKWSLGEDLFYFDDEGRMKTGWQTIDGKKYYFSKVDGGSIKGWHRVKLNGKYSEFYYDPETGQPLVGLHKVPYSLGKRWFYFDEEGRMQKGWKEIDGKHYHFKKLNGANNNKWNTIKKGGKRSEFYFDPETGAALTGMHKLKWSQGKGLFLFDEEGRELRGWQEVDGEKRWFSDMNGAAAKGWKTIDGTEYYFDKETGIPLKGLHYLKWSQGKRWFYFDETSGKEQRGWRVINDQDYYFSVHNGAAPRGWKTLKKDGKRSEFYFYKSLGYIAKGLQKLKYSGGESWFYLGDDGRLQKGWKTIDNKDYYFNKVYGAAPKGWTRVKRDGKKSEFYFDPDEGYALKGLNYLEWSLGSSYFYFDKEGRRYSGWKVFDGKDYFYFKQGTGNSPKGWYKLTKDGKRSYFYFDPQMGAAVTGRHYLKWSGGGDTFLFDNEGRLLYGDHEVEINGEKLMCNYDSWNGRETYCDTHDRFKYEDTPAKTEAEEGDENIMAPQQQKQKQSENTDVKQQQDIDEP